MGGGGGVIGYNSSISSTPFRMVGITTKYPPPKAGKKVDFWPYFFKSKGVRGGKLNTLSQ